MQRDRAARREREQCSHSHNIEPNTCSSALQPKNPFTHHLFKVASHSISQFILLSQCCSDCSILWYSIAQHGWSTIHHSPLIHDSLYFFHYSCIYPQIAKSFASHDMMHVTSPLFGRPKSAAHATCHPCYTQSDCYLPIANLTSSPVFARDHIFASLLQAICLLRVLKPRSVQHIIALTFLDIIVVSPIPISCTFRFARFLLRRGTDSLQTTALSHTLSSRYSSHSIHLPHLIIIHFLSYLCDTYSHDLDLDQRLAGVPTNILACPQLFLLSSVIFYIFYDYITYTIHYLRLPISFEPDHLATRGIFGSSSSFS